MSDTTLLDEGSKLPQVPQTPVQDPALRPVVDAVRTIFNTRAFGKDKLDRWVTWRDLVSNNIVVYQNGNQSYVGSSDVFFPVGSDGTDFTPPPTPSGFTATAAVFSIILEWADPQYTNYSFTEIWRSTTNNLGTAVKIGTTAAYLYADTVGSSSATYFYWIRFVSKTNVVGAYNSTTGISATTGRVGTADLSDLSITANKLAGGSVTEVKLADGSVVSTKIADSAVVGAKIANLAVDAAKLANSSVTSVKIADASVVGSKLANLAVEAGKLANSAVTAEKIANLAVGTAAIQDAAINSAKIADLAVGTAAIQDAAINSAKIANLAVGNAAIANLAVTTGKIADLAVDSAKIANASIVNAKIADAAISSAKIQDAAITNAKIGSAAIQTANIQDGAITNAKIQDASITNAKIGDTIQSNDFSAGSAGWRIQKSGAAEFNNATFRGTIDVKSSATGARLEIKNNVIKVIDAAGVVRAKIGDLTA